ncbi:unnamed protein product [Discosporangium mesarthrocarpum]
MCSLLRTGKGWPPCRPWSRGRYMQYSVQSEVSVAREEAEEDKAWVAANPTAARASLQQPPFHESARFGLDRTTSLDSYLNARDWPFQQGPSRRFLSHMLTYPLTLAQALISMDIVAHGKPDSGSVGPSLSVCCVGARAEGSLPLNLWRETLFSIPSTTKLDHIDLHMVGPEVNLPACAWSREAGILPWDTQGHNADRHATVELEGRALNLRWSRSLLQSASSSGECCQLTEDSADEEERRGKDVRPEVGLGIGADLFVLFNPGLAHPALHEGWLTTAKMLLRSQRPLMITSHSLEDMAADVGLLRDLGLQLEAEEGWEEVEQENARGGLRWLMKPQLNDFRSLRRVENPLDARGGVIAANWGLLCVAGCGGSAGDREG